MKKKEVILLELVIGWLRLNCPYLIITLRVFIKDLYAKVSARCSKIISCNPKWLDFVNLNDYLVFHVCIIIVSKFMADFILYRILA